MKKETQIPSPGPDLKGKILRNSPERLYAVLVSLYQWCSPSRTKFFLIPRGKNCWEIKGKNFEWFIPSPRVAYLYAHGLETRLGEVERKYSHPPVEVERGDIVCDVGAYVGDFSVAVARKADRVFAFEPDPFSANCLRKNTAGIEKIHIVQKALWERNTELKFNLRSDFADSSILNVDIGQPIEIIRIQALRLDGWAFETKLEKIDFLKIDAEGAEPEVLKGAETFLNKIDKIAVDCSPERYGKPTFSQVCRFLERKGFKTSISEKYVVYAWKK
jgi:FkbM family methyltransferase